MDLIARALSYVLIPCFLVGMGGSLVVVAVTIVHDFREVLSEDEAVPGPEKVITGT